MINEQKALNNAFFATIAWVGYNVLLIFLYYSQPMPPLHIILELILFLLLGYLTKLGKKTAAITLLVLFIIDRFIFCINFLSKINSKSILPLFFPAFITVVLWSYFYAAYLATKKLEESKKEK